MESVIDIGAGDTPYFIRYRIPCEAKLYMGVDTNEKKLLESQKKVEAHSTHSSLPETKGFVVGNATQLSFRDGFFDTAMLSNVLSAPIHWEWDVNAPEHTTQGLGLNDLFYRERKKVVEEALRVLRPGGKLFIYTDLIVYGQHSYEMVIRELEDGTGGNFRVLPEEQARIDRLNVEKVRSGHYCYCFLGDLLPKSSVYEITKR